MLAIVRGLRDQRVELCAATPAALVAYYEQRGHELGLLDNDDERISSLISSGDQYADFKADDIDGATL